MPIAPTTPSSRRRESSAWALEARVEMIFGVVKMYDVEPIGASRPRLDWIETRVAAAL